MKANVNGWDVELTPQEFAEPVKITGEKLVAPEVPVIKATTTAVNDDSRQRRFAHRSGKRCAIYAGDNNLIGVFRSIRECAWRLAELGIPCSDNYLSVHLRGNDGEHTVGTYTV